MKFFESRLLWGGLLILAGAVFLLQNLGILKLGDLFWVVIFGLAGIFFLSLYIQNRVNWWALIPGITLLSLGLLVLLNWVVPSLGEFWGGSIVLGGVGISFVLVYLLERTNWWAVIPGGVLLTLALVAAFDGLSTGLGTAGIFFLGVGLTFAIVALLPNRQGEMRWAWIPAAILLAAGLLFLVSSEEYLGYLWPAALIVLGGILIVRALRRP
jgi:isoprenylcysteine carboxyl methyltransferase (ICMT) family protein YpbQ